MASRYWVVGGDYADCNFSQLTPGTESIHGPYECELRARKEWQRLTFRDRTEATRRYTIASEGPRTGLGFGG